MSLPFIFTANAAFLALQASEVAPEDEVNKYITFARDQLNILLGEAGTGFVVGVGPNAPTRPHHRGRWVFMGVEMGLGSCCLRYYRNG